jgi:hypothetical protein
VREVLLRIIVRGAAPGIHACRGTCTSCNRAISSSWCLFLSMPPQHIRLTGLFVQVARHDEQQVR